MGKVAGWFKSKNDRIRRQALNNSFAKKYELLTVNETETEEERKRQVDEFLKNHKVKHLDEEGNIIRAPKTVKRS